MKYLEPLYSFYLNDRAAAIRKLGVENLPEILKAYSKVYLNPLYTRLSEILGKETSYHFKITVLYAMKTICLDKNNEGFFDKCIESLAKAAGEPVPNIREVCVKCYQDVLTHCDRGQARETLKKQLVILSQDTDSEVKQCASALLAKI